ncbi:MAG: Sugar-binding cellulase-like [Frondihabitans sp.]|nr:Sugar-binding cellulase-like [Frondihabitans sp.]
MAKAVTMWEFSWLLRRAGAEAEYADVDRILDELVERGYDTVRIDAFPHLVSAEVQGHSGPFFVKPQEAQFMWGPHGHLTEVANVTSELLRFLRGCADRGVGVGLSSWFNGDAEELRLGVETPTDLAAIWSDTIGVVDAAGLLDVVEYVDLCNEFPLREWLPNAHDQIFARADVAAIAPGEQDPETRWIWSAEEKTSVAGYFRATDALRQRWPGLRYTVSFAPVTDSLFDLDVTALDLVETHVWLSENVREYGKLTNFAFDDYGFPGVYQKQIDAIEEIYWPDRASWHAALEEQMARWATFAREASKPLWTTEAWSHVLMDDFTSASGRPSWDYVKSVADFAVPAAVRLGWEGVCTSNFSQPHFPGLWSDVDWHRRLTDIIKSGV